MKAGACSEEGDPNLTLTAKAWARGRLSVMTRVPLVQSLLWKRLRPRGTGLQGRSAAGRAPGPLLARLSSRTAEARHTHWSATST